MAGCMNEAQIEQEGQGSSAGALGSGNHGPGAAALVGVHRNTAAGFSTRLRHVSAEELATASPVAGEVEVDESYVSGVRTGQRGRGAAGQARGLPAGVRSAKGNFAC